MTTAQPIFQSIFGNSWHALPPVFHHHYANRPFSCDRYLAKGLITIELSRIARLLSPLFRLFGALVPYEACDIPVLVWFKSEPNSNAFRLERTFYISNTLSYQFQSRLLPVENDTVIEYVKYGIGWRHRCYFDGNKVILKHRGYVWKLAGRLIPVPLSWLLGKGYAEEVPISENSFAMKMCLIHPLFGTLYEYRGQFEMADE